MHECSAVMKLIDAYLDGQLDVGESLGVESHLQECEDCREHFLAEKAFRSLVHDGATVSPAPEFTARCLRAALDREVRHRARPAPFRRLPWMAAAILLAAGVVLFVALRESHTGTPPLITQAVGAHANYLRGDAPLDVYSQDCQQVSRWLSRKLPFAVDVPCGGPNGFDLVGGRALTDSSTPAAFVTYDTSRGPVSLMMMPPQETRLSGRDVISYRNILFHPAKVSGFETLEWSDNLSTYVLVSSSKPAVYQACVLCHQSDAGRRLLSGFASNSNGI